MNEVDKQAFAEAAKDWSTKSAGKDLGEYFWQAAIAHRDAQPAQGQQEAVKKDAVFDAAIEFVGTLTGMTPPPIEVAPPEVFKPFRDFTEKVCAIFATIPPEAQGQQEPVFWYRPRSDGFYEGPIHNRQIELVRKHSGGWVALFEATPPAAPDVRELKALLLWALYHHQGGSSSVGQPIRKALGIGEYERLTEQQIAEATQAFWKHGGAA